MRRSVGGALQWAGTGQARSRLVRRLRRDSQSRSGRPRVAVHPYYGGSPSVAGRGRTNAGESPRDACPAEFARSRGLKSPRRSAGRRGIPYAGCQRGVSELRQLCLRHVTTLLVRRSALRSLGHFSGGRLPLGPLGPREERRQAPAASANNAGDAAWLFEI
jgi:hypothetical protein